MRSWPRTIHALLVGGWLGAALLAAFAVAPSAFASFATRAEAGSYVGGILRVIDRAAVAAGLVATGLAVLGGDARFRKARIGAAIALTVAGVASLLLDAKIASLRASLGAIDALPMDDPGRRHFGMLHGISIVILLAGMIAAAASIVLEQNQDSSRRSSSG